MDEQIFSMSHDEFLQFSDELTEATALEPETFAAIYSVDDEFLQLQRIETVRNRAKELGISGRKFDSFLSAFRRSSSRFIMQQRAKDDADFNTACGVPAWCKNGKIDEMAFAIDFNKTRGLVCINGQLYGADGHIQDEAVLSDIQGCIARYVETRLAGRCADLLKVLKNYTYTTPPPMQSDRIFVKNGCVMLDGHLSPDFSFTLYRLPVEYRPDAEAPEKWLDFIYELLEPEDVQTLQEFMGYCMIPTTKAQKMLFLIGSGGEGKSVIGSVMKFIFGPCMVTGSLHDLDENRFALVSLENELIFLDDELSTNGCRESKVQKQVVTASAPVRMERKGQQSYNADICCRLMAFGNVPFNTLHDHSEGAYRRRIILNTKPKAENRQDNPNLTDELREEKDAIFLWAFRGLQRLISNGWRFTISEAARNAAEESKQDSFSFLSFLNDKDAIELGVMDSEATSADICAAYKGWCRDNAEVYFAPRTVLGYLKTNAKRLKIKFSTHTQGKEKTRARGFKGVKINRFIDLKDYENFQKG